MSMKPATPARKQAPLSRTSRRKILPIGTARARPPKRRPIGPRDMTLPSRTLISSQEIIIGDPISIRGGCGRRRSYILGRSQS
jgi:hypothetical protein